ncbi:MAG: efflux RND transporter permease subunit [Egibacteraceae bacterium]
MIGSSLKFRRLVVVVAAGLMVFGITQLGNMPADILPEFSRPTVEVQTEALGLSAEEVEQLITVPLEQDLLNGVAFLEEIESASLPGLSSVVLTFEPGTSLLDARQVVAERLTQAVGVAGLPEVAKPPQMLQPLSSTSRVSMVKLSSAQLSPIEMSLLARWVIVPRLVGVDGVANVAIWGFRDRQLQVLVDPRRLAAANVSLDQVISTTGNALEVSPLSFLEASSPGTGGFIDTVNQRLHVFHEQAISTPEELGQVPVEGADGGPALSGDRPLTLGEVTEIVQDHQPLIGDAVCSDGPCLLLVVEKFPEANTPEVTRGIEAALDALRPGLDGMEIDTSVYRPATFIEASFDNLGRALLIGGILLVLLLGAFFFEWRAALIGAVVVAMSLLTAGLVLYFGGVTVHTMTLAGLAMALVVLVDDAVIDIDSMARRLREHPMSGAATSVFRACLETRGAALCATLIVGAALLPFFFMQGEAGAFLPPIAVTHLTAVAASMLVALTLTPALGLMLLANAPPERREPPVARWLRRGYGRVAGIIIRPGLAFIAFGAVLVVGLAAVPFLDQRLRPTLEERDVLVDLRAPPGTSLPRMDAITARAVDELRSLAGVAGVGAHVGRAVTSDQIVNVNAAQIWVNLDPSADYDAAVAAIKAVADRQSEVSSDVLTYSAQRITDVLRHSGDEIVVRVYGEDRDVLRSKAVQVQGLLAGIEGVEGPRVELTADEPTLEVEVDIARARAFGLKPGDVRREAATLLGGIVVGNLFEEQKVFDVVVWGAPDLRRSESEVRALPIAAPEGGLVRLDQVADVRTVPSPSVIRHESVARYVDVSAGVAGRDVGDVVADVRSALAQVEFPLDHHAELLGGFADQQAARARVLTVALAAAIGVLLLFQAAFTSWRLAVLAFVTLPMALVGGVLATLIDGGEITLGSVAGFVAVLGIAARNSILLIKGCQRLERHEGQAFGLELVVRGTRERLGPILLTALASALVFAPVVIAGDAAGFEIVRPLAVAVLGGLVTSTALGLVVVPAAYLRYGFVAEPDTWSEDLLVPTRDEEAARIGAGDEAR